MSEHEQAHSAYGGSVIERVINCPGSVALVANVPPRSSRYAEEGTLAHTLAEYCLRNGERSSKPYQGREKHPWWKDETEKVFIPEDMVRAVDVYLDAVWAEVDAPGAELYIEQRFVFDLKNAEPGEVFGANDALVYQPAAKRLVVFDYKHGVGVSVSVEDNAQLKFYAAGAALSHPDWQISTVELVVVQPRAMDADINGEVRRWTMHPIELIEFAGQVDLAVGEAKQAADYYRQTGLFVDGDLATGKWCRWCDAAAVCPAAQRRALEVAVGDFNGVVPPSVTDIVEVKPALLPDPRTLDVDRLAKVRDALDFISAWATQVDSYMLNLLEQGIDIPGWKLVDKQGRRTIVESQQKVVDYMTLAYGLAEDDVAPRKLLGITEMEKRIKSVVTDKAMRKAALDDFTLRFTDKPNTGRTMVRSSDRRQAVNAVAQDFGSVILDGINTDGTDTDGRT